MEPEVTHRRRRCVEHQLHATLESQVRELRRGQGRKLIERPVQVAEVALELPWAIG